MVHVTTFLILIAMCCTACAVTLILMLKQQYHHRASDWFATVMGGLCAFLLEILIWRYPQSLKPVVGAVTFKYMIIFSQLWGLAGSVMVVTAVTRLAWMLTGSVRGILWKYIYLAMPALVCVAGIVWLAGIANSAVVLILQCLVFGSITGSLLVVAFWGVGEQGRIGRCLLIRLGIWSALFLPVIIMDAVGGLLPEYLNDLPFAFFAIGACVIGTFEAYHLFSKPTYLVKGVLSGCFIDHFGISPRESEVVALVLEGGSNAHIAEHLFISEKTVENHLTNIFRKTGVKNRIQLFRLIYASKD